MGPGPEIKDPDGFNDQTVPLAFHLTTTGTVNSDGPYPVSGPPHRLPLVPWKCFRGSGIHSHSLNLTQEAWEFIHAQDGSRIQGSGEIYKMKKPQS